MFLLFVIHASRLYNGSVIDWVLVPDDLLTNHLCFSFRGLSQKVVGTKPQSGSSDLKTVEGHYLRVRHHL